MSLLSTIQTGRTTLPPRLMIYGQEGVGKSTFAARAPQAIFIQTEDGLGQIDCAKFPLCTSIQEVFDQLNALLNEEHTFGTLAIDSLDWLERLIHDAVCTDYGVKSIEKADGGYGKGYIHALTYWRKFVSLLDALRQQRGLAILLIAHAKIERFEDPENPAYDRYTPRLHKTACALLTEWADGVLFAFRRVRVSKEGERALASAIGADGGERILRTNGGPACVAKNRYGLPTEVPLDFTELLPYLIPTQEKTHA